MCSNTVWSRCGVDELVVFEFDQFGISEYVVCWEFLGCDPVVSRNVAFVSVWVVLISVDQVCC